MNHDSSLLLLRLALQLRRQVASDFLQTCGCEQLSGGTRGLAAAAAGKEAEADADEQASRVESEKVCQAKYKSPRGRGEGGRVSAVVLASQSVMRTMLQVLRRSGQGKRDARPSKCVT